MYFSHKYLLRFSWFIYRSSVSVANRLFQTPKPFWSTKIRLKWQHVRQGLTPGCCSLPQPSEEEGVPGSPLLFQHTKIFLVWKTLTASKENIAPLPVHPNFGNLEFKFLFGTFFSPKAVFLADMEVLDKLIS